MSWVSWSSTVSIYPQSGVVRLHQVGRSFQVDRATLRSFPAVVSSMRTLMAFIPGGVVHGILSPATWLVTTWPLSHKSDARLVLGGFLEPLPSRTQRLVEYAVVPSTVVDSFEAYVELMTPTRPPWLNLPQLARDFWRVAHDEPMTTRASEALATALAARKIRDD